MEYAEGMYFIVEAKERRLSFAQFKEMRDTVNEYSGTFSASLTKATVEARQKVKGETKTLRGASIDRNNPVVDNAKRMENGGSKAFISLYGKAIALAENGNFLDAGTLLDLSWYAMPTGGDARTDAKQMRSRALNELIQRAYDSKDALAAEELVRVFSWLGMETPANPSAFLESKRIINAAIASLEKAGDIKRAFELAAFWLPSTFRYDNYDRICAGPLTVTQDQAEGIYARWKGL